MNSLTQDSDNQSGLDILRANMALAAANAHRALPTQALVELAISHDNMRRDATRGTQYRAAIATICIHIYEIVESRCVSSFPDPETPGPIGVFSGSALSSPVFHMLDIWAGEAAQLHTVSRRARPLPRRQTTIVDFGDDLQNVRRRRIHGLEITERDTGGLMPGDSIADFLADNMTGMLDYYSGIMGVVESLGSLVTPFIPEIISATGSIAGLLSTILSLPLALNERDDRIRFSAKIDGFANAMQDMADRYSSPNLRSIKFPHLPAPPRPACHRNPTPTVRGISEHLVNIYYQGEAEGRNLAIEMIQARERHPSSYDIKNPLGTVVGTILVNGRGFLLFLNANHGSRVKRFVINAVKRQLRETGHAELIPTLRSG